MAEVGTYNPASVTVSFSGLPIRGFAPDTFIALTRSEAGFETIKGVDDTYIRIRKGDPIWTVEITLLQSSPSNAELSAIHILDLETENGSGIGLFGIADTSGTSLFASPSAWIQGWPENWEYGPSHAPRTWKIDAVDAKVLVGGN